MFIQKGSGKGYVKRRQLLEIEHIWPNDNEVLKKSFKMMKCV